jgi:hypothetical protein
MMRLSGTGDPLAEAHRLRNELIRRDEQGIEETPSAEKDERRAKLAADLVALHPSLHSAPLAKGPSYGCAILTDDPECPMPDIHIGIDTASVMFSYSADFQRVAPELRRVIAVFERYGYTAYDRQTDSIVTSSSSFGDSAASFAATRDSVVHQMQARGETVLGYPTPRTPFWVVAALAILVVAAVVGVLLSRQHYENQVPEKVRKELLDLKARLNKP